MTNPGGQGTAVAFPCSGVGVSRDNSLLCPGLHFLITSAVGERRPAPAQVRETPDDTVVMTVTSTVGQAPCVSFKTQSCEAGAVVIPSFLMGKLRLGGVKSFFPRLCSEYVGAPGFGSQQSGS